MEQKSVDGRYDAHGVQFRYPETWEVNEESRGQQVSISVSSPGTSFWVLSLFFTGDPEDQLIESALNAFHEEYEELDIYPAKEKVCGRESLARDLEFSSLELINSAFLRAFRTEHFSALILYQGTDHELELTREELENISGSLQCDGEMFDDSE